MDGTGVDQNKNNDLEALKGLQADASELERIESLLNRFNIFEAIGVVTQELMHSNFLAFLLDPRRNHGLGDLFLKKFLRKGFAPNGKKFLPLFHDLDQLDLDQTLVRREHRQVDILLTNEAHKLAVIIENKVWTMEHSDQLHRYYQQVMKDYPGWQVLGIYLTPYGVSPSHEAYVALGYGAVCGVLDGVIEDRGSDLVVQMRMAMEHYADMVRRNIVGDSEVVKLCQQMYRKHKRAFDLVYEHRPDQRVAQRDTLIRLVSETEGLVYKGKHKNDILFFRPQEWEEVPAFNAGDATYGFFRFVFHNTPGRLNLFLETSPGDETIRRRLFEMGQKDEGLFNHLVDPGTQDYPKLYRRTFLTRESFGNLSDPERELEIRRQWAAFLEEDLPRIDAALKKETWIWESVEADG